MKSPGFKDITVNPFTEDIVSEPRDIPESVAGLNDAPLQQLLETFASLEKGDLPRLEIRPSKAQLLISPQRGYGKSHLLGRLFKSLHNRATRIYLRPFADPHKCWHSILLQTVQELERTDNPGPESVSNPRQLWVFATGVISHLAADYIAGGSAPGYDQASEAVKLLRSNPLDVFEVTDDAWNAWLRELFASQEEFSQLAAYLQARIPQLMGREEGWLRILFAYAFSPANGPGRKIALKWLRGEPLEPEEAQKARLTAADNQGKADMSAAEINTLSFERLAGLCRLAGFYRPLLFCFDQTEFYGTDPLLVRTLGSCIERIYAEVPNQLTVITANSEIWATDILPRIGSPQQDRISHPIELEPIKLVQAKELIVHRLAAVGLGFQHAEELYGETWLTGMFASGRISVRRLLQDCAARLRVLQGKKAADKEGPSIEELFKTQVNLVKSKPALQAYSQDALMWFTGTLAHGIKGVMAAPVGAHKWFSTRWTLEKESIYFAFEGGDNSARWKSIAKEAQEIAEKAGTRMLIVFRTADLGNVPKPSWTTIRPIIEKARKSGLRIHQLEPGSVCEIHAARDLYSDALQGNIDPKPNDVLAWLKAWFEPRVIKLFQSDLKGGGTGTGTGGNNGSGEETDEDKSKKALEPLTATEQAKILRFIEKERWTGVDAVMKHLNRAVTVEVLLQSIAGPNIKTHPGPKTIVIQWRKVTASA